MRSYVCALGGLALCLSSLTACSNTGDYQVAVTWLINGTTPNQAMCQEHGIARARFEVRSEGGRSVKTIEGDCAATITLSDGSEYGGFYTNTSFDWDTRYDYTLTLVDAAGAAVSIPASASFGVDWGDRDLYELSYLDYVNPLGKSASLTGEWQFANGTASSVAADCAAQRVSKVRILATSALDDAQNPADVVPVAEADCSAGRFESNGPLLATGNYFFYFQAVSDAGAVVTTTAAQEQFVDFNTKVVLMRASFFSN
ncbi:MAG TPA: hypothetical protein VI299_03310 [Polyangiales bacterium]